MMRALTHLLAVCTAAALLPRAALAQVPDSTAAQLTLEQALSVALEQNYGIRIARNTLLQAENDVTWGNAGLLPEVTGLVNYNNNRQVVRKQTTTLRDTAGNVITDPVTGEPETEIATVRNVGTAVVSGNVTATWRVFQGNGGRVALRQLDATRLATDLGTRQQVETVIAAVVRAYYELVRAEDLLALRQAAARLSEERLELARAREEVGRGSRLEYLQATVDYNTDRSALLQQQVAVDQAVVNLNELLARAPRTAVRVGSDIPLQPPRPLEELSAAAQAQNLALQLASLDQQQAQLNLQRTRAEQWPTLDVNGAGNYFRSEAGELAQGFNQFPLFTRTTGYSFGASLNYTLFDGLNLRRRITNGKIDVTNAELTREQTELALQANLSRTYASYRQNLTLVELEQANVAVAERTLEVARERYQVGSSSALELREAQNAYIEARNRLLGSQLQAKLDETELERLSGALVAN